jgi:hypothetical protein
MTYLIVDDGFDVHPKVEALTDRAYRLHTSGLFHCAKNLTDGSLTEPTVRGLCARIKATTKHLNELVSGDLWLPWNDGGYTIKNYLDWNPSKAQVEERRAKRAAAGAKGGRNKANAKANAVASASDLLQTTFVPDPIRSDKEPDGVDLYALQVRNTVRSSLEKTP